MESLLAVEGHMTWRRRPPILVEGDSQSLADLMAGRGAAAAAAEGCRCVDEGASTKARRVAQDEAIIQLLHDAGRGRAWPAPGNMGGIRKYPAYSPAWSRWRDELLSTKKAR